MTFLFEPAISGNPRILTVSVRMPSGYTIDVIFKCNVKDWCNPEMEVGKEMPNGIITSTIFILIAENLKAFDTLYTDQEMNFTSTLLYDRAPDDWNMQLYCNPEQ